MRIKIRATLLFVLAVIVLPDLSAAQPCPAPAATCIDVDWALDPTPNLNYTCTYCADGVPQPNACNSGLFFPAQGPQTGNNPNADGRCSLRRALREASARPAADRPILIRFTGLATNANPACTDGSQDKCDDGQYNSATDSWRLYVGPADTQHRLRLGDVGVGITLGQVGMIGPALATNGMPKVFLDGTNLATGDNDPFTMGIHMTNNRIENLGFLRGGDFIVIHNGMDNQEIRNNTFGLHPDGAQIEHIDPGDVDPFVGASSLAGNNGVLVLSADNTDNVAIENNFFAGMEVAAVQVASGTTGIVVQNNHIGTRIDGTVPNTIPLGLQCNAWTLPEPTPNPLDPGSWYGGTGIDVLGTGALIDGNVLAGLHIHRSTGINPPVAIRVQGDTHVVQNNLIGLDDVGYAAGVCGEGIQFGGELEDGHQILDNQIHRPRMTLNHDGPIVWIDTTQTGVPNGGTTVRGNIVTDAGSPPSPTADKVYEMGANIQPSIKNFEPAEITGIVGTLVTGRACPGSPCANCLIDFYLDDDDGRNEALEYLGTTTANAAGDFSFTLAAPLAPGFGIRTMTTSVAPNQIGNGIDDLTAAGTTTEESSDDPFDTCIGLFAPGGCQAQIDLTGTIGGTQTYSAQNRITTANAIFDGTANVALTAGVSIELGNGTTFETGSSAVLAIEPGVCP